jgi:hypothetical protein
MGGKVINYRWEHSPVISNGHVLRSTTPGRLVVGSSAAYTRGSASSAATDRRARSMVGWSFFNRRIENVSTLRRQHNHQHKPGAHASNCVMQRGPGAWGRKPSNSLRHLFIVSQP